jgi:hypothetical protein
MVPHAEDNGSIRASADELLLLVVPGLRWKTTEEVESALDGMSKLGLIAWDKENEMIKFPESFFKIQSYIGKKRRGETEEEYSGSYDAAEQRKSPQSTAEQRKSPPCLGLGLSSGTTEPKDLNTSVRNEKPFRTPEAENSPEPDPPLPESEPAPGMVTADEVVCAWNEILVPLGFRRTQKPSPQRKKHFGARIREDPERSALAWWKDLLTRMAHSGWMCEQARQGANWLDFAWILSGENLTKILEGKYDDNANAGRFSGRQPPPQRDMSHLDQYDEIVSTGTDGAMGVNST